MWAGQTNQSWSCCSCSVSLRSLQTLLSNPFWVSHCSSVSLTTVRPGYLITHLEASGLALASKFLEMLGQTLKFSLVQYCTIHAQTPCLKSMPPSSPSQSPHPSQVERMVTSIPWFTETRSLLWTNPRPDYWTKTWKPSRGHRNCRTPNVGAGIWGFNDHSTRF